MNAPILQPPAVTERPNWRATLILFAALFGMLNLAWAAAVTMILLNDFQGFEDIVLFVATIVGAFVSILHAPFICMLLWRADLKRALPFVYGLAAIPTVVGAIFFEELSVIVAIIAVFILSAIAAHHYPAIIPGTCEKCGYSLHGLPQPGCPECGWGREA